MFYVCGCSLEGETNERRREEATRTGDHVPGGLTGSAAQSCPGRVHVQRVHTSVGTDSLTCCCPRRVWSRGQDRSSTIQLQKELKEARFGP